MLDISPVLEFINRTGEHCVFFNPEDHNFFMIMPLAEYEKIGGKKVSGFGGAQSRGRSPSQQSNEPFVEPWQTSTPNFAPEPPIE